MLGRAHGIRGEVLIDVRTDEPERRLVAGTQLRVEGSERTLSLVRIRNHSGRLLAEFAELTDRNAAERARGTVLVAEVDPEERPVLAEEYYDRQLVGLTARRSDGSEIGPVTDVLHLPAQDTLEIATPTGPRLIPFVHALVPTVDLSAGFLVVADVEGLLDEET